MRLRVLALLLVTTALGVTACGGSKNKSSSDGGTSTQSAKKSPIVIGAAIAESGILQAYDLPTYKALELYAKQTNKKGGANGRQIKLIKADTHSDPAQGRAVAEQLLRDGADVMVVSCDFDFGSPAAQAAQDAGKLVFSLCAQSPKFGAQGIGPLAYSAQTSTITEGTVDALFAWKQGYKTAYNLVDTSVSYGQDICKAFTQKFKALGGKVVGTDSFKQGDSSLASQVSKARDARFDTLMLCSYPPSGAAALRQLRAAGINAPIISTSAMDGTFWVKAVPTISDLFVPTTASMYGDDPSPGVNQFFKDYKAFTGGPALVGQNLTGWSDGEAIVKAIEKTGGDTDGKKLAAALDQFKDEPLLIGPTTYTKDIHIAADRPMKILQFTKGKPKYIETIKLDGPVDLGLGF